MSEFEQKVIKMLESISSKLDTLLGSKEIKASPAKAEPVPASKSVKPSAIVEKQEEEKKIEAKPPVEGRRVCPNCQGTTFNAIEDKSKVMYQQGGMKVYAKKYVCKTCGYEM